MNVVGGIKIGQPAQAGIVGNVVAFEYRYLTETGQAHNKKQNEIEWFHKLLLGIRRRFFSGGHDASPVWLTVFFVAT